MTEIIRRMTVNIRREEFVNDRSAAWFQKCRKGVDLYFSREKVMRARLPAIFKQT